MASKYKRALKLKIEYLGIVDSLRTRNDLDLTYYRIEPQDEVFRISGGFSPHILIVKPDGTLHCDCRNALSPCSHVIRYQRYLSENGAKAHP